MRPAEVAKVEPVAYIVGGYACKREHISDDPEVAEFEVKKQFHEAKKDIRTRQEGSAHDGYILYLDHVYKLPISNNEVIKITGTEAKQIKRRLRAIDT